MCADLIVERVKIAAGGRALRGELAYAVSDVVASALIVGPHPHMGGSMDNNVVAALASALPCRGVATLRFDYSALDRVDLASSMAQFWQTGHAPEDDAMLEEARAAATWLAAAVDRPWFAIGYSFGALAAAATLSLGPSGFVLIAPTVRQHAYIIDHWPSETLVIYSDNDFATPRDVTERWLNERVPSARRLCIRGGTHFYTGHESTVTDAVAHLVDAALEEMTCRQP